MCPDVATTSSDVWSRSGGGVVQTAATSVERGQQDRIGCDLHSGSDWSAASSSGAEELCVLGGCTEREGLGILLLAPSSQLQDLASNKFFYCWIQYRF